MKFNKGFTLIELLVVIVIIGILATLATVALSAARVKARDAKRISDIKQMQTALELYYNEENTYPPTSALTVGQALVGAQSGKTFMGKIPAGPNTGEIYTYAQINGGTSYTLAYVLEKPVNELAAGAAIALPGSINNQCSPNCSGKYCGDADGCGGKCTALSSAMSAITGLTCSTGDLKCGTALVTVAISKIDTCTVGSGVIACGGTSGGCTGSNVCGSGSCVIPTPCNDTTSATVECNSSSAYGSVCGGGYLFCKAGDLTCGNANLVAAPSNCYNSTTCNCVTDSYTAAWKTTDTSATSPFTATDLYIGYNNMNGDVSPTESSYAPSTLYPAAKFCADLNINGFNDWYLPSKAELCSIVRSGSYCGSLTSSCIAGSGQSAASTALNGCTNSVPLVPLTNNYHYYSSTEFSASSAWVQVSSTGLQDSGYSKSGGQIPRCVRRF